MDQLGPIRLSYLVARAFEYYFEENDSAKRNM
jgi:hypothetical protein